MQKPIVKSIYRGLTLLLLIYGLWLTRHSIALDAVTWMHVFRVSDFPDFKSLLGFLLNLRIAIPPVIATLEILSYQLTGTTHFVSIYLYRAGLIASYLLALRLAYPSVRRMLAAFAASVVFIYGTVVTHPGNPQVYDVLYPAFLLSSVLFLKQAGKKTADNLKRNLLCLAAGFFLSMTELSRPFFILILPFVLLSAWFALKGAKRSSFLYFLLPLLLFSGIWHAYIGIKFDQIFWSNNGGFNLWRAWKEYYYTDPVPMNIIDETHNQPLANDGRWANLNTPERFYNSQEFQRGIMTWWVKHPKQFATACAGKLLYFFSAPTKLLDYDPQSPYLFIFRYLIGFSFLFVFVSGLVFGLKLLDEPASAAAILANPNTILLIVTILSTLILALTEKGEEIRLIISLLPMLALYPLILGRAEDGETVFLGKRSQTLLFGLSGLLLLAGAGGFFRVEFSSAPIFTFVRSAAIVSALTAGGISALIAFYNKSLSAV
jgi:hypothetical protein